jgi:D-alanyl-D-alanine carboxypeptidase
MALLAREFIATYPDILRITGAANMQFGGRTLNNTNLLLQASWHYAGADGFRTGTTREAGFCLLSTAYRDGRRMIAVVMGAANNDGRYGDTHRLLDFGFAEAARRDAERPRPIITEEEPEPEIVYIEPAATFNEDYAHIPWVFSTYAEPDFRSQRMAFFSPQYIDITYEREDGWALINTTDGEHWAHLRYNMHYINRPMGIFSNRGDVHMVSVINPQVVAVLAREGRWLHIETWLGPKWINLDFTQPVRDLDRLLARFGDNLAVYFENLETGFVYGHNADRVFFGASVSKAAFALYIYEMAERGEVDLSDRLTFTSADYNTGSGVIRDRYPIGTSFTMRELLRLNLSYSDNIATLMLVRHFGTLGYRQFVANLGGNPAHVRNRVMNSNLTARDAGLFARAIHDYIESGGAYSEEFRAHLLDNQFPFIVSDYPVAGKTGWTRSLAWHDMAIVYAPSPYVLVILSARDGWTARDYRDFAEISMAFQNFNDRWFVAAS